LSQPHFRSVGAQLNAASSPAVSDFQRGLAETAHVHDREDGCAASVWVAETQSQFYLTILLNLPAK
jgi:hypothetical protein